MPFPPGHYYKGGKLMLLRHCEGRWFVRDLILPAEIPTNDAGIKKRLVSM